LSQDLVEGLLITRTKNASLCYSQCLCSYTQFYYCRPIRSLCSWMINGEICSCSYELLIKGSVRVKEALYVHYPNGPANYRSWYTVTGSTGDLHFEIEKEYIQSSRPNRRYTLVLLDDTVLLFKSLVHFWWKNN